MNALAERFLKPENEFTPFPFWFLNGDLKEEKIESQMCDFVSKGIYGVVLHPRVGVPRSLEYLSDAFMQKIVFAVKTARRLGMKVLLYDEGMYPSGSAHGKVVEENPDYAAKGMRLVKNENEILTGENVLYRFALRMIAENEYAYGSVRQIGTGETIQPDETMVLIASGFTGGTIRGIHEEEDDGQRFAPKAGDLLNADAMQAFIRHTHEVYYRYLSDEFGSTIIGFFTDEPSPTGRASRRGMIPWTDGFDVEMIENGFSVTDVPALFLKCEGNEKRIRAEYERHINARLIKTYYRPISKWCERHKIALGGHPHSAQDSLLLTEFQIPGQDIVWRWVAPENDLALSGEQSAQAKCASDIARHTGARRNLNECFGCCGPKGEMWALNVWDMKWYLNWLFARGCNFIIPHAFFYELDSPIQADRPPDVGPNNIFWDEYPIISDYIKRMCMLNTDSVNQARIAVLCASDKMEVDEVRKLYENQIEFNYLLDEHFLSSDVRDGRICICEQNYDALIVPRNLTYAPGTTEAVLRAKAAGVYVTDRVDSEIRSFKNVFLDKKCKSIRISHLKKKQDDVLIVSNEGERTYRGKIRLPFEGECLVLNPWNGTVQTFTTHHNEADIEIGAREIVVITNARYDGQTSVYRPAEKPKRARNIDASWRMQLPGGEWIDGMRDWQDIDEVKTLSGKLLYSACITIKAVSGRIVLDLGDVREKAEVFVNGHAAGVRIAPAYCFDITEFVHPGENKIQVWVTNALVGKYEKKSWPSGMLGGSKLRYYDQ